MLVGLDRTQGVQQLTYEHGQPNWHGHEQMHLSTDYVLVPSPTSSLNSFPGDIHGLTGRFQNGALPAIVAVDVNVGPEWPVSPSDDATAWVTSLLTETITAKSADSRSPSRVPTEKPVSSRALFRLQVCVSPPGILCSQAVSMPEVAISSQPSAAAAGNDANPLTQEFSMWEHLLDGLFYIG